ncbi:unnamed protein product [Linum trigynum]|uniref:Uncharacterized protein n=1 Tax=Linum trigynum TaxID=586398 RepID=A0AAV2DWT1_9ROSI
MASTFGGGYLTVVSISAISGAFDQTTPQEFPPRNIKSTSPKTNSTPVVAFWLSRGNNLAPLVGHMCLKWLCDEENKIAIFHNNLWTSKGPILKLVRRTRQIDISVG